MNKPKALMVTGFGINCDYETGFALSMEGVGLEVDACHLNDLVEDPARLDGAHLFVLPGGFSYGDHLGSGRVLANRLKTRVGDSLLKFLSEGKLVLGICNGFQVLVKMGLLPGTGVGSENPWKQTATLFRNDSSRFEDRWVHLKANPDHSCVFLEGLDHLYFPIRHGEGKLIFDDGVLANIESSNQNVLVYADAEGNPTSEYPLNPNGSQGNVAGLCDATGRIFGLMPHPEAFLFRTNHPTWTRENLPEEGQGVAIFRNAAKYIRKELLQTAAV